MTSGLRYHATSGALKCHGYAVIGDVLTILAPGSTVYTGDQVLITSNSGTLTIGDTAQTALDSGAFLWTAVVGTTTIQGESTFIDLTVTDRTVVDASTDIDSTGTNDVTDALNTALAALSPGDSYTLASGGTYRCDGTVLLSGLTGVQLNGNGATITTDDPTGDSSTLAAPSSAARNRAHVKMASCVGCQITDLIIVGPNSGGGAVDGAYVEALEAQHAVDMDSANKGCSLVNVNGSLFYGDGFYLGHQAANTIVTGCEFHHTGRQGCSPVDCAGVYIIDNSFHDTARSIIDFEPALDTQSVDTVVFSGNEMGDHKLNFIAAAAPQGTVNNIWITGTTAYATTGFQATGQCIIGNSSNPHRKKSWTFSNNTFPAEFGASTGSQCVKFTGIDGLTAQSNTIPLASGRGDFAFGAHDCTGVTIDDTNTVTNGELLVTT